MEIVYAKLKCCYNDILITLGKNININVVNDHVVTKPVAW